MRWKPYELSASIRRCVSTPNSGTSSLKRLMSTRTYRDAIEHLNSLQSNAATLDAVRASGGRSSEFAIPEMLEYLERIGYAVCVSSEIPSQF